MIIRVLIVDDEPLARQRIADLLRSDADVKVVGECESGADAIAMILAHQPDLVFLDVQMPEVDGFDVLRALEGGRLPAVIFVTAYDQYALRAFDVHALDYLLKPFDDERFYKALERARWQIARGPAEPAAVPLTGLLKETVPARPMLERLLIKSAGSVFFLRVDRIDWIEAAGNYLRLHVGDETHLLRDTMNALEARLDSARFLRIHRSTIVNIERIKELQPGFHGEYAVILRDNTQLALSRNYRRRIEELFGGSL